MTVIVFLVDYVYASYHICIGCMRYLLYLRYYINRMQCIAVNVYNFEIPHVYPNWNHFEY